jgi:hypothetical protein
VSSVEASRFEEGAAYVTFDGHRSDHFNTWIFKTSDFGRTWTSIAANLPADQPLYVVREDVKNPRLLFVGSEFTVHVSLDGGGSWQRLGNGMPTVATHDLVIHPRDGDLIAATHGRGFYVLDDITPLQQWNDQVAAAPAHLFEQRIATLWNDQSRGGARGHLLWAAPNPPYIVPPPPGGEVRGRLQSGALLSYYLRSATAEGGKLEILEPASGRKRTLGLAQQPGVQRALWDLRFDATAQQIERFKTRTQATIERLLRAPATTPAQKEALTRARGELVSVSDDITLNALADRLNRVFDSHAEAGPPPFAPLRGDAAGAGEYVVRLSVGGASSTTRLILRRDPNS